MCISLKRQELQQKFMRDILRFSHLTSSCVIAKIALRDLYRLFEGKHLKKNKSETSGASAKMCGRYS